MSVISYTQEMNHTLCVVDLGVLKKSVTESYILNWWFFWVGQNRIRYVHLLTSCKIRRKRNCKRITTSNREKYPLRVNSTGFFVSVVLTPISITGKLPQKKPGIVSSSHLFQEKSTNEHTNMSATSEKWNFLVLLLIAYHKLWRMNKMPSPFFRIVSISNGEVCMVKFLARVGHFCQSGSGTWRFHFKDL